MAMTNTEKQRKHRENLKLRAETAEAEIARLKTEAEIIPKLKEMADFAEAAQAENLRLKAEAEIIPKLKAENQNLKREAQKFQAEAANIKTQDANSLKVAWTRGVLDTLLEQIYYMQARMFAYSNGVTPSPFGMLQIRDRTTLAALDHLGIKQTDARTAAATYFDWCPQGPGILETDQFYDDKGCVLPKMQYQRPPDRENNPNWYRIPG